MPLQTHLLRYPLSRQKLPANRFFRRKHFRISPLLRHLRSYRNSCRLLLLSSDSAHHPMYRRFLPKPYPRIPPPRLTFLLKHHLLPSGQSPSPHARQMFHPQPLPPQSAHTMLSHPARPHCRIPRPPLCISLIRYSKSYISSCLIVLPAVLPVPPAYTLYSDKAQNQAYCLFRLHLPILIVTNRPALSIILQNAFP